MAKLSLVCRFFCRVCQPRLFQHLRFYGQHAAYEETTSVQIVGRKRWREALVAGDPRCVALNNCVKACSMLCWTPYDRDWSPEKQEPYTRIFEQNTSSLPLLPHLTQILLDDCPITPHVLEALARIPQLQSVEFDTCLLSAEYPELNLVNIRRQGWSSLRVYNRLSRRGGRSEIGTRALFNDRLAQLVSSTNLHLVSTGFITSSLVNSLFPEETQGVSPAQLRVLHLLASHLGESPYLDFLSDAHHLKEISLVGQMGKADPEFLLSIQASVPTKEPPLSCTVVAFVEQGDPDEADLSTDIIRRVLTVWTPAEAVDRKITVLSVLTMNNAGDWLANFARTVFELMLELFTRCKVQDAFVSNRYLRPY
ncbi:hypothetical protein EIP86_005415 [Pleurotus ostreatoroseus]|nr:hypothetical protein EIP86_005415 [Pleurotus ostreatoroseus]